MRRPTKASKAVKPRSREAGARSREAGASVGDKIDVIMDSGIQRGTHVIKALSLGAKAVGGGRFYLYALAAAGQQGVELLLQKMKAEINRDMILMGCKSIKDLNRSKVVLRKNENC